MVKVLIHEDSEMDLIGRYGNLARGPYDVWVYGDLPYAKMLAPTLRKEGFDPEQIINRNAYPDECDADIYFVDGMEGRGLEILRRLPREKAFLNSRDPPLIKEAKEVGLNVVQEPLEKLISRTVS